MRDRAVEEVFMLHELMHGLLVWCCASGSLTCHMRKEHAGHCQHAR